MIQDKELQDRLIKLKKSGKTFRNMEVILGVSNGTLCRIYHGIFPKKMEIRKKLNLPLLGKGKLCPVHNKVHSRICKAKKEVKGRSFLERIKDNPDRREILRWYIGLTRLESQHDA